jgi:hypothetical protein
MQRRSFLGLGLAGGISTAFGRSPRLKADTSQRKGHAKQVLVVFEQVLIVIAIIFSLVSRIENVFTRAEFSIPDDPNHIKHILGQLTFGIGAGVLLGAGTGCLMLWLLRMLVPARVRESHLISVDGHGAEAAADWDNLKSSENYVGYGRTENFASPGKAALDKPRVYAAPAQLKLNHWALSGDWTVEKPSTVLNKPNGRIAYRFHARDLHLVMGPPAPGTSVRFRVLIDGQPPGSAHGGDVDDQGNGTVAEQRLYQLIRQPMPIADRQFEIEFLDPGVEAFAFTFG